MTRTWKTIAAIAAFVVFMAAAGIAYNILLEKREAESPPVTPIQEKAEPPDRNDPENTGSGQHPREVKRLEAPNFTAVDGAGNEVSLHDFKGTPVVLSFWASWCSSCRKEIPVLDKLSREYGEDELVIIAVDLVDGARETLDTGKKYVEDNGFAFRVLYDTRQEAAYAYGIRFIPSTLFIDSDGYIVGGYEGPLGEEGLRIGMDFLLGLE